MHEALLYQKLSQQRVRCDVCQRHCLISGGKIGYCQARINKAGKLYTTIYGLVSSINNDPIEKKPVFHYKPGSICLSLGSFGCNFRCQFCQNWEIVYANGTTNNRQQATDNIEPGKVVRMALDSGASGIALTYNEPTIWLEYSLDIFRLTKARTPSTISHKPLYTCWVTNGYATKEAIDLIAPSLDIYRVDLKSFNDNFYQKLIKIPKADGIFEVTKYVKNNYPKVHIECITNIIPCWNDSPEELNKIAEWIVKNLGPKTPWHVTRFFPAANMLNIPPTPPKILTQAQEIGFQAGLNFVYIGNITTKTGENTYCPKCKKIVVKRLNYLTKIIAVKKDGRCKYCNEDLNIKL